MLQAQTSYPQVEITGFGGYTFKNSFDIVGGKATIGDGFTYGGSLAFGFRSDMDVEFYYSRQESTLSARSTLFTSDLVTEGNVSYWMLGGVKNFETMNPSLNFYGVARIGGVTFSSKEDSIDSETKFAASFGGGMKYLISDQVGIKISGNVLFPIMDVGANLWFGTGGAGVGVSSWSPIVQFNFNGGVFIRISK